MKQKLYLTSIAILLVTLAQAQIGIVPLKDYANFKNRVLLVIVEEPLPRLLGKLEPEQLEIYKREIEEYNTLAKWAMDTYYKVGNTVEYKTREEAQKILAADKGTYAYLEFTKFGENYTSKVGFQLVQKNRAAKDQTHMGGIISLNSILSAIDIRFSEDYKLLADHQSPDALYRHFLPDPFPDKSDMVYAFRQIAAVFDNREKGIDYYQSQKVTKQEAAKLQTQTLLIAEGDISSKEDRDNFIKAYNYPMEIVSYEKMAEAINGNNSQNSCVLTVPLMNRETEAVEFRFVVYDCGSGKTLAMSSPQEKSGVSTGTVSAFKAIKKATTESQVPQLIKENLMDFNAAAK
jgi:hypothetical protein